MRLPPTVVAVAVALVAAVVAVAGGVAPAGGEGERPGVTEHVSTDSSGGPLTDFVRRPPVLSGDGRIVVWEAETFCSPAPPRALPCGSNIHVKDRLNGSDQTFPSVGGTQPAVSRDGCTVVFVTEVGFDPRDIGGQRDVYAADRCRGRGPDLVSTGRSEAGPIVALDTDLLGDQVAVSADGRIVALLFAARGEEGPDSLVRYDRDPDGDGDPGGGDPLPVFADSVVGPDEANLVGVTDPSLSDDGRRLVYSSDSDPRTEAPLAAAQVWTAELSGTGFAYTLTSERNGVAGNVDSVEPVISGDGRVVAFTSFATNLTTEPVPGCQSDDGCVSQVMVRDAGSPVELVSRDGDGQPTTAGARRPALTLDGALVAFADRSGALVDPPAPDSSDTSDFGADDILVADRAAGRLTRISVDPDGDPVRRDNLGTAISSTGRSVAFLSAAGAGLVDPPLGGGRHQFVRDRDAILAIDPLDVGTVTLGRSATGTTTVTNTSALPYVIATVAAGGEFETAGGSCAPTLVLAPGRSCALTVRFTPAAAGARAGPVSITSAGGFDAHPTATGAVTGTGQAPPTTTTTTTTAADPPVTTTTTAPTPVTTTPAAPPVTTTTTSAAPAVTTTTSTTSTPAPPEITVAEAAVDALAPVLVLSPAVVRGGGVTTATGTGFAPAAPITLTSDDGSTALTVTTDGAGTFREGVVVPHGSRPGTRRFTASGPPGEPGSAPVTAPLLVVVATFEPQAAAGPLLAGRVLVSRG